MRFPLLTSFCGGLLIFAGCAYGGYRVTIRIVYPRHQSKWFNSLDRHEADRLRQTGLAAAAYQFSLLSIQNTPSSLQHNVAVLATIRRNAPQELWPIIDLRLAKDYAMTARLEEQAGDSADAAAHRQLAAGLLRSAGWKDVSDESLTALADKEFQLRIKN